MTVTTTATQKVISSFTGVLGTKANSSAQPETDVCYQKVTTPASTQPIKEGSDTATDTENYTILKIAVGNRATGTNHVKFVPGAGTFAVGFCVDNAPFTPSGGTETDSPALDDNDFAQGWAIVAN